MNTALNRSLAVRRGGLTAILAAALGVPAFANNTPQTLPFSQNWSNVGLITTANDWSGVPGILGYRGDDLTTATGTDPQTILVDGTTTPLNVQANQTNPNTNSTGGLAEFELTDPVVALNGSGTADAPFMLIHLNTTGGANITFTCQLRDIDGSTDNAVQPIAFHYRIGNTGNFTNIPAAFVADATTGPSLATLVTSVNFTLPAAANNQPLVEIRVMTTNAAGNDEWVGVDDILITAGAPSDSDGDGVPDVSDNCPNTPNPSQADCDNNGVGDACDPNAPDSDGDGVCDGVDNCPNIANPGQEDCNQNTIGDVCDIHDHTSNDVNSNGIPDECEVDCNGNNIPDTYEISQNPALDGNSDGIIDSCENTIAVVVNEVVSDPGTVDMNNDGIVSSTNDECIEIVNNTAAAVDIGGWTISDEIQVRHTFPQGTSISSQCGIIVFGGGTPTGQFGGMQKQIASTGTLSLNNSGDTVTLRDSLNLVVSIGSFGSSTAGVSFNRNPDLTGPTAFVKHTVINPALNFSIGKKTDGTLFGGCSIQPDADGDGIPDAVDNCPNVANANQADCDSDGLGDACDPNGQDANGNGIPDECEIASPPAIKINEVRLDEPGTDNDEYFEIKGTAGTSLNGMTLIVIGNGTSVQGSGVIECIVPLQHKSIPSDGLFLCCESTMSTALCPVAQRDLVLAGGSPGGLNFENGENRTYLLVANFHGTLGQDLDATDDGTLDAPVPWSAIADAVSVIQPDHRGTNPPPNVIPYAQTLGYQNVGPDGVFLPGQIYRCGASGTWTVGKYDPFDAGGSTDTPGVANLSCPGLPCPADIAPPGGNGAVDVSDLLKVINSWGNCPAPPATCVADIAPPGGNGIVDVSDLLKIINSWGPCP